MSGKERKSSGANAVDAEVMAAISAFEQILEAIPNDRASLEALSHAYQQIGDSAKAKDYLIRLGHILLEEDDQAAAADLKASLVDYAEDDPEARELLAKIEKLVPTPEESDTAEETVVQAQTRKASTDTVRTTFSMAEELSFAWNLMEANELTQEEYASVVQDLTEMSASETMSTVSVLHVLEARGFKNLERILGYLSKQCGTPLISLAMFDFPTEAVSLMPMDFMVRRGALIFELIGNDALAAVMNPYDKQLRKDVEAVTGKHCHFFLTLPKEFDQALEKMSAVESETRPADG